MKKMDRVRILEAKPLPSGKTVQLIGHINWIENDGTYTIRIATPGLYCGGIYRLKPDEFETF